MSPIQPARLVRDRKLHRPLPRCVLLTDKDVRGRRRLQVGGAISDHGQTLKLVFVNQPLEGSGLAAGCGRRLGLVEPSVVSCREEKASINITLHSW